MRIAVDVTALTSPDQFRGIGVYTKIIADNLARFDKKNVYAFLSKGEKPNGYDLLLLPYFSPFILQIPVKNSEKIILTIHDLIPIKYPDKFPRGIKGEIIWHWNLLLLKKISRIITDSQASKKDIIKYAGINDDKIHVIYPAVSDIFRNLPQETLTAIKQKYHLPAKFILYVGDCNWNKNVSTLVKASLKLKANLVLIGRVFTDSGIDLNHPWNQSIKEVNILTNGQDKIIKLGFVPTEDLVRIYNLADVYVQPSFDEGFGYSVIEAMKCGCPVLSSNRGSLMEIGGDAVKYFDPSKIDELTNLMNKPLPQQDRSNLITKGYQQAGKFSLIAMIEKIKNVYNNIV